MNRDSLSKARNSFSASDGEKVAKPDEVRGAVSKDRLTKKRRSWNMSRIRGKNTTPERVVRSLLHRMGYRFRLPVRIPVPLVGTARRAVRPSTPRFVTLECNPSIGRRPVL
jgi:hypothetical protein